MRRSFDEPARRRAVIAVAALYALLLQAFLVTLHPVAPFAGTGGVICAEHGTGTPIDDGVPCQHQACCLLTQVAQPLSELASTPDEMVAPPRRSTVLAWRPAAPLGPRAPPDPAVSSRGPPTV